MRLSILFETTAWDDYMYWYETDKKILSKINGIIKDCQRTPFEGVGKPEKLKNDFSGCWSRRIDREHRFVHYVNGNNLVILQCRFHYDE
jgi:toxin YoeB